MPLPAPLEGDPLTAQLQRAAEASTELLRICCRAESALKRDEDPAPYLRELQVSALRQHGLLRCLQRAPDGDGTDLRSLLRDVACTVGALELFDVPLDLEIDAECERSPAGCFGLYGALIDLVLNALEASQETGGAIRVSLRQLTVEAGWRPELGLLDGEHACLVVADQGAGMTTEVLEQAFTDGFSTKPHASGLGLSGVRQAICGAGGAIHVASAPGRGTRVSLYLPLGARMDRALDAHGSHTDAGEAQPISPS